MGTVHVLYGGPAGLTATRDQVWHQGSRGVPGVNEEYDSFGDVLAVGDFEGDGFADLVVGVPVESLAGVNHAGQVVVLRGSPAGLAAGGAQLWNQGSPGIADDPQDEDRFGAALAVGDVNADGRDDLAISAPWNGLSSTESTGATRYGVVHVLAGSPEGLTASGSQLLTAASAGVPAPSGFEFFGTALAMADVNADGRDDLAVGGYESSNQDEHTRGRVVITRAGSGGAFGGDTETWDLDRAELPGSAQVDDWFAESLATGDFNGDGAGDVAIGASGRCLPDVPVAGAVYLLNGSPTGMTASPAALTSRSAGTPGATCQGGQFGYSLAAVRPAGGTIDSLAVGSPVARVGTVTAGTVTVVPGSSSGLVAGRAREWSQGTAGVRGAPKGGDEFGISIG